MIDSQPEFGAIVKELWEATAPLPGEDAVEGLRARTFERLLTFELNRTQHRPEIEENKEQSISGGGDQSGDVQYLDSSLNSSKQREEVIADRLRIQVEEVKDLFDTSDEEPTINLHSSKLSNTRKGAVREIALLLCGARTALGLETGTNDIRKSAKEFNQVDGNFMSHLASFEELAIRGKPGSQNRQVRLKSIGWEALWKLAQSLTSNGA